MQRAMSGRRGHEAHGEAHAGAGIAEIEGLVGRLQAGNAHALDMPDARRRRAMSLAPRAVMALAVLTTSSASRRPLMRVSPMAMAPSMRARCDMDLSPGTLIRPFKTGGFARDQGLDWGRHSGHFAEFDTRVEMGCHPLRHPGL